MFDIVTPTYNRPKHLARALRSLSTQLDYVNKILIVDNGDNPDTFKVIERVRESEGFNRFFTDFRGD